MSEYNQHEYSVQSSNQYPPNYPEFRTFAMDFESSENLNNLCESFSNNDFLNQSPNLRLNHEDQIDKYLPHTTDFPDYSLKNDNQDKVQTILQNSQSKNQRGDTLIPEKLSKFKDQNQNLMTMKTPTLQYCSYMLAPKRTKNQQKWVNKHLSNSTENIKHPNNKKEIQQNSKNQRSSDELNSRYKFFLNKYLREKIYLRQITQPQHQEMIKKFVKSVASFKSLKMIQQQPTLRNASLSYINSSTFVKDIQRSQTLPFNTKILMVEFVSRLSENLISPETKNWKAKSGTQNQSRQVNTRRKKIIHKV